MSKRGYSIDSDTQPAKVTRKNDEPIPQTSKTDLTSHVDLTERSITVGQDKKASDKNQSATTKQVISIIEKSVNPASTIQGELYCTYLAISIILHQFKKQNKFVVATEVSEAGKFDDILYHYESPNDTSTFYIQAKHKKKFGVCITERDLCVTNGEFSIPMYFSSFLAIDKKLTEGVPEDRKDEHKTRYAICTNAELHKNVERYFTEIEPQEDESLQFCEDIGATCYQFFCDIPALIAPLRKSYIDKLKTEIGFYTQKDDFFSKFLLICKSCNQEKLRSNAGNLLPKWCDKVQRETVIDKLEALLINSIHNQRRYYMNLERMQHWISEIEPNQHVGDLRRSSEDCLKSGQEKYPYVEIDPKRLKELKLYAFVKNASDCGVYEFNSRFDWIVSCRILDQALSLLQCETLFVDSTKYTTQKAMMNILDDLLLYLRDVNHSAIKVITILANHSHGFVGGIKKITEKYCHKIIVVVKMSEGSQKGENFERILVQDLSENASNQLHKQAERMMFGTIAPLSSIVEATDDLSFLIYVLELCGQSRKVRDINLNEHNYEQIKHWYVQRHFEPYDYEGKPESSENLLIKGPSLLHVERVLASNDKEPVAPSFRESNGGKVCIFLNDAGFGKTTYFTWLAWHLSTSDPSLYFVKITALEYSTDFDRLKQSDVQNSDDIKIVRILYRYIHLALFVQRVNSRNIEEIDKDRNKADDCAKLLTFASDKGKLVLEKANKLSTKDLIELRMFQQKFNHKKLVIILDGFDEITPYYKDVVMKYFERVACLKGVRSLYLSSRPYGFEGELKNTFACCQMYRLKPFTNSDIILSFHKFLLTNLDGYKHFKEEHRNDILVKLYRIIQDVLNDVITVPLLLYMVQIILLPEIKKHVNEGSHTISSDMLQNANLDILHLVEQFVERKIKILSTDKRGTTDSACTTAASKKNEDRLKKEIMEQHMLLAMHVIFDKHDRVKLFSRKEQKRAIEIIEEVNQGDEKTGIVLGVQNGVPQFLHRTFAEYFTARWFFENWDLFKSESFFRSQTFWSRSLRETREFFDRLILRASKGCDLHLALVNKSHKQIKEILHKDHSAVTIKDNVGRLPLHLLHYYSGVGEDSDKQCYQSILNRLHEVNQILNCVSNRNLEFINQKDELYEWNALDYTFVSNEGLLIEHLSTIGVKPDMDNLFQQVCSNTIDTLLMQETEYTYFLVHCIHRKDLVEELSERVARYLIDVKKIDIYSPLAELNSLSVLEKVVTESNFCMFHQLITKSDAQALNVGDRAIRLLQLSLKKKSNDITYCLVECLPCLASNINDTKILFFCTKSAIQNNRMELFKTLFKKFCVQHKIDCVEEDNIIDECINEDKNETYEIEIPFENDCCFEFSYKVLEVNKEGLLSVAIHYGNMQIVSYILQKTNMLVTVELIGKMIQHLSTLKYQQLPYNHRKCVPAFQYLFKKSPDLYAFDKKGLNLFLSISKNGCVYMLHSLIAIGFAATKINLITHSEIFQQRLNSCTENASANIFVYLQQRSIVDFYDTVDPINESIFYKIIKRKRFLVAQALVEDQFRHFSNSEKQNAVLDLLHQLLLKFDSELILEFPKHILKESSVGGRMKNGMWISVYSSICQPKLNKLHLVERIINRKIEIFIKDKAIVADKNTEEQWKKEIKEQHMLLASYVIFDKNDREILLSSKEQKRAIEIIEEVNQGDVTTGIVIGVQNEVPQFIHRMYAEYFTACWLYENRERFKSESIFRSQTIWSYRFKEIREFFDRLILRESEGCDLHLALVNKSHEEIKKVLRDKPSLIDVKDKVGRLPLHLLHYLLDVDEDKGTSFYRSILNKLDEVNQILQNPRNRDGEFINQKDELCKWNALDYAFVLNEWDLTGYLFTKGVEPDMDNLFEQVCSNHLDTLLVQEKKYTNKCFGRKDLPDVLSERMAKYLIEHKQIDVYSPIAELNSLSVLDKVVTIGSLSMLRQLITTSDPQGFGMDDRANRLLQLSLDNRFDKITMYLVEQHPSLVSFINDGHVLYFCAKSAIQNNLIELFITIFTKFCFTQKIDCVEEDKIIDEFVDLGENETFEVEIPFEKYCCIQYTSQELESNEEGLLCAAIHYGNIQIVSYILQKTNKAITFKLVKQIMQQLRGVDHIYRNHKTCAATFKYLFKKIPDLYAVDEEELNLFLMTIKYGCVYMLHSLIAIGFDTTKINMINLLKVFQQRLNSWAEKSSANIFVYLEQRSIVDFYDKLGPMSERIFDIAISKERFIVAKALVENKFRNLSNSEKQNVFSELQAVMPRKFNFLIKNLSMENPK